MVCVKDVPVTLTCGYCGAELDSIYDITAIRQLLDKIPLTCPNCNTILRKQTQYDKIVIDIHMAKRSYRRKREKRKIETIQ